MTGIAIGEGSALTRQRLERRLRPDSLRRLTSLTAGPGFGKTTLLTQSFHQRHALWHTVTTADVALSMFARNVVRKLRLVVPELSADLVAAVEGARGPDLRGDSGRPVAIAAALAEDLDDHLERDVVLVLDDVHELQASPESISFLAALCRLGPRRLRIVTASRLPLPFPTARLAVAGEVEQLGVSDLAFTADEIAELAAATSGGGSHVMAGEILTLTGGWPAAVVLAIQAGVADPDSLQRALVEKTVLFDYLAEEALAAEMPADIDLLRDIALLPWVNPDLLEHLGLGGGSEGLLAPGAPWMTPVPDMPRAVAVSPLVREFIAQRYPGQRADQASLLVRAADWYLAEGAFGEALHSIQGSGKVDQIVRVLGEHGDSMLAAGMTRHIVDAVGVIPRESVSPHLLALDAEARQLLGDWEGALDRYRVLVPEDGPIPPRLAWRVGFLHHMRGDVTSALQIYERGELGTDDSSAEAALLGWQGSAYWLRGERAAAKRLADAALERARASADHRALATAHTVLAMVAALDGDRALNDLHYIKALEHAEKGHDVVQTIRIRSNRGSHFLEEGAFDAALAELDIALRLADMTGFELWRGMALGNRGQVNVFRGRLEEALADLIEARATFRRIGSRLEAYPLATIGDIHAARGDTAQARALYTEAIRLADEQADLQALIPARSGLARVLADREPDEAVEVASLATKSDFVIGRAQALVAAGWAHLRSGDVARSRELASEGAEVARSRHDLPALAEALELDAESAGSTAALELLDQARGIWESLGVPIALLRVDLARSERIGGREGAALASSVAENLQRFGVKGLARRARAASERIARRDARDVVIKTLGGFDVMVGESSVAPSAWQSRVAREILWMLVAARQRPLNREILIDRLWPGDQPAKASNRLSVALSTIRRVLDPADRHPSDHYLQADREVVALRGENLEVDVEEFFAEARRGRALLAEEKRDEALALLNRAEERYVGEFLEEQPYADWAVAIREEARSEYMGVASLLAEAAESNGDHDLAARRYLRMLERDAYNEPAHIALVRVMDASGRHGTARRLYGNYVSRMSDLDVEPEPFPAGSESIKA